ncbi:oxidoreductase family protein [Colletotrichum truncatum]|uniref:Oxidoreductase family protein n=1 Tax=Colletotrichum truncatum TaxID=5467 RepID=A0ACC3Z794_COLTU|nr:oxidoreductase family protein [Colletotrichum truncatum]KAF6785315.1 oxidoreductase family protein [Colletotrichum truncatum]
MTLIRVAIVGLASSDNTSWASNAHLPYLLSPKGREKYQIVALCNSSVEKARHAIKVYDLPAETKAFGDPGALAKDEDVDLVVCCTRVDVHYKTILPSILAGKAVYLEWPLAHDVKHSQELVEAARMGIGSTIVGLQGRVAPVFVKIRELLEQQRVGKVVSSEFRAIDSPTKPDMTLPVDLKYFTQKEVGGNLFTIYFAHLWDQVQHVLGEVENLTSHFQIQHPNLKIVDPSTRAVLETVQSDVPDLIIVAGTIVESSNIAQKTATVSGHFRFGATFPGEPRLKWSINCEKGEIRLTAGSSLLQARGYDEPVVLEVYEFGTGKIEAIEWTWSNWQKDLPIAARSVAELYERFAASSGDVPTIEDALHRHKQLEVISFIANGIPK